MKRCLINFADGVGWYRKGAERLKESFIQWGFDGDYFMYTKAKQLGCPSHCKMPYAFKAYAFMKAKKEGYQQIIWCDSSMYLVSDVVRIYEQLNERGYMLVLNGWDTGTWCSDTALPLLGITREESFKIPHLMANTMAFDLRFPKSKLFLDRYYHHSRDGSFKGAWKNKNNEVSTDSRVKGHRHDQTAASVIAWKLGMRHWLKHWVSYNPKNFNPCFVFHTHPAK